mmetsp:Transcript_10532/g.25381  ORF Transcript_10532/g.25381 Transcript_10532/m.25381 type:complete len:331 (-) Transcript_10532:109-1101(-)
MGAQQDGRRQVRRRGDPRRDRRERPRKARVPDLLDVEQRRRHGARLHDLGAAAVQRQVHHGRHPVLRVLPAGPELRTGAGGGLRRRDHVRANGRRPRHVHGPAQRLDPGLLQPEGPRGEPGPGPRGRRLLQRGVRRRRRQDHRGGVPRGAGLPRRHLPERPEAAEREGHRAGLHHEGPEGPGRRELHPAGRREHQGPPVHHRRRSGQHREDAGHQRRQAERPGGGVDPRLGDPRGLRAGRDAGGPPGADPVDGPPRLPAGLQLGPVQGPEASVEDPAAERRPAPGGGDRQVLLQPVRLGDPEPRRDDPGALRQPDQLRFFFSLKKKDPVR